MLQESLQREKIPPHGVQVSVDDFGTGTRDLDGGNADEAIVKAIIKMAQSLGLATVAEGVETQEQARKLTDLRASYVQGFFFSPPLATDRCGRLLAGASVGPESDDLPVLRAAG